jgi:hypothetical protein
MHEAGEERAWAARADGAGVSGQRRCSKNRGSNTGGKRSRCLRIRRSSEWEGTGYIWEQIVGLDIDPGPYLYIGGKISDDVSVRPIQRKATYNAGALKMVILFLLQRTGIYLVHTEKYTQKNNIFKIDCSYLLLARSDPTAKIACVNLLSLTRAHAHARKHRP